MKDNIIPKDKWEFDKSVTDCFENMLSRSIPQYDVMRSSVTDLGLSVLDKNILPKTILDIGCSNGLSLEPYIDTYGINGVYKGIDSSQSMLEDARKRFDNFIKLNVVNIDYMDLRCDFPKESYSLIQSILTIQFTPIEYRQRIIQNIYDSLNTGGVFIFVEKVLGNTSEINEILTNEYLNMKKYNGYSNEQIERKKLSLEGVLVPVTSNWNIDLLKQSGFKKIDTFWRWMNFVGYIAIK